jgi:hypothetical protein
VKGSRFALICAATRARDKERKLKSHRWSMQT